MNIIRTKVLRSKLLIAKLKKCKAIPVTGREGPWGCETSRLPHFLDNRLTDAGEVVSLTLWPAALYLQEDFWYSFLLEAGSTLGPTMRLEGLGQLKNPMTSSGIEPATFRVVVSRVYLSVTLQSFCWTLADFSVA
jgi:hypothetical protein